MDKPVEYNNASMGLSNAPMRWSVYAEEEDIPEGINVNIEHATINVTADQEILARIEGKLNLLMATEAELLDLLGQMNSVTSEIAQDITDLLARPAVPDSVRSEAAVFLSRLQGVASAYPPVVVPPEEVPGSEPIPA